MPCPHRLAARLGEHGGSPADGGHFAIRPVHTSITVQWDTSCLIRRGWLRFHIAVISILLRAPRYTWANAGAMVAVMVQLSLREVLGC